jgi:hypothetical protein
MVVDRLSNEAAADTMVAQKLGNQSELRLLRNVEQKSNNGGK